MISFFRLGTGVSATVVAAFLAAFLALSFFSIVFIRNPSSINEFKVVCLGLLELFLFIAFVSDTPIGVPAFMLVDVVTTGAPTIGAPIVGPKNLVTKADL